MSIPDKQNTKGVSISQTCVVHGKRYNLYCSLHDKPLCIDCADQHKGCSQLMSLDNAAANAKQSTALVDLEDTINGVLENVDQCIKNQESIRKECKRQKRLIKKNIKKTRSELNTHLDFLEKQLLENLSTKTLHCKLAYRKGLQQLYLADQKIKQLKDDIETMKQNLSDVQVFIGTRELNETVTREIKSIKSIVNCTKYHEITLEIESSITSLFDCVNQLGTISVVEKKSQIEFKDAKLLQAQKEVPIPHCSSNLVFDLQLKQKCKFRIKDLSSSVSSCLILPNGHMLMADFWRPKEIMEYNERGHYVRGIFCSGDPYHLAFIDPDRIAVTYCSSGKIAIRYLRNTRVRNITLGNNCSGISYHDGKLYVLEDNKGIVVLEVANRCKILYTLQIDTSSVCNIVATNDRLYYTNGQTNTISCLSLTGKKIWMYQDKFIVGTAGITVANDKDVLVLGVASNNLSMIKQDGQESKILLKETDGLIKPRAVYYNKERKKLLVCNESDMNAQVYTVIED